MGNRTICQCQGMAPCAEECTRLQAEIRTHDVDPSGSDFDPAGTVFSDTLEGLPNLDQQALRFAGTANLSAVRWLLALGANPLARDSNGTTLLHVACRSGSLRVAQELLRHGLPLSATDVAGWTPLHIVAALGRRDIAMLLLRARANTHATNRHGVIPAVLCLDPGTRDILEDLGKDEHRRDPLVFLEASAMPVGGAVAGEGDSAAKREPFCVPRAPAFRSEAYQAEFILLGLELFLRNPGHGLAFFVAAGVVVDHPMELGSFLLRHKANPTQLGEFLGEDFSLAQTLRLALVQAVDLRGTGAVNALQKVFQHVHPPQNMEKLDRLASAVANLWWRSHDPKSKPTDDDGAYSDDFTPLATMDGDPESELDASSETDDASVGGSSSRGTPDNGWADQEVYGLHLFRELRGAEGLWRLMFSIVMLYWNFHRTSQGIVDGRFLSLRGWMDMNLGIDEGGGNVPEVVQKSIYQVVVKGTAPELQLRASPPSKGIVAEGLELEGWLSIPAGGLEHHESGDSVPLESYFFGTRFQLAHCVLSEVMSSALQHSSAGGGPVSRLTRSLHEENKGEIVWLSLRFSQLLLLATSRDSAPYAVIPLREAVLREAESPGRQIVLTGRRRADRILRKPAGYGPQVIAPFPPVAEVNRGAFGAGGGGHLFSEEDAAQRMPLPLCFLLSDGRFYTFKAQWLELQCGTDADFCRWTEHLKHACALDGRVASSCSPSCSDEKTATPCRTEASVAQDCASDGAAAFDGVEEFGDTIVY